MMRRAIAVSVFVWLVLPASASAAEFGIGIRAGTQGLGVEGVAGLNKRVAVRGGIYGGSVSVDVDEGGIDYDGDLDVGGYGLLVDIFPLGGKFRVSAGVFSNDNEITIRATPTQNIEIGGNVYTPAEVGTLSGGIGFDSSAPYAGIGWGRATHGGRLGFLFDFGALFQGSGDVSLLSDSMLVDPADLAAEIQEIEDDISEYDVWPVVSFGLAIRF